MWYVQILWAAWTLQGFILFHPGHHACRSCSKQRSYRDDPSCAECRKPKGLPHRIYLSSDDLADEPAGHIIDTLNEINAGDTAERIASVSKKLKRFSSMDTKNPDVSVRYIVIYSGINSGSILDLESITRRVKGPRRKNCPPCCTLRWSQEKKWRTVKPIAASSIQERGIQI